MRSRVDLPEPFGPRSSSTSPPESLEIQALEQDAEAPRRREIFDLKDQ